MRKSFFDSLLFQSLNPLLIDTAAKGLLILAIAFMIARLLNKSAAARRHLVWALAVVSLLCLPLLSLAVPQWHLPLPEWSTPAVTELPGSTMAVSPEDLLANVRAETSTAELPMLDGNAEPTSPSVATPGEIEVDEPGISQPVPRVVDTKTLADVEKATGLAYETKGASASGSAVPSPSLLATSLRWLPLVWLAGALLALLKPMLGFVQLFLLQRRATAIDDSTQWQLFEDVRAELNIRRPVQLLSDNQIQVPLTWGFRPLGFWRPTVLLPAESANWNNNRRRMVFLHELAHVKRFDWLLQTLSHLAVALHWFNPIAWHAARRLCVEQEQACDDMVISLGASACDYADELVHFSTLKLTASASALPISRESTLQQRVARLLDGSCQRLGISASTVLWGAVCCLLLVVPISMLTSSAQESASATTELPLKDRHLPRHLSYGGLSTFYVTKNGDIEYTFLYVGDFDSSSNFTSNTKTNAWHDDATLATKYGKVHFTRDWTDAQHLTINGRVYPLKTGRVFVIDTVNGRPENPVQINQVDIPVVHIAPGNLRQLFEAAHQPIALSTTTVGYSGAIPQESARVLRLSSYSRHDNFRTRFAFIRAVPQSGRGADLKVVAVNDSNDPKKKTWQIDTTLDIDGKEYRVRNSSETPDKLLVNDREFDLTKGRILSPQSDKTWKQHFNPRYPGVIQSADDLLAVYTELGERVKEQWPELPVVTRHASKEFSVLAFQTEKDVAFTFYTPGFLQTGLSYSITGDGYWKHRGVVNLMKDKEQVRQFRIYYSAREPDTLYIDGKAYPLVPGENPTKLWGRLFILDEEQGLTPLQSGRALAYRDDEDLEAIHDIAKHDLTQARILKNYHQLQAMPGWTLTWNSSFAAETYNQWLQFPKLKVFPDGRMVYAGEQRVKGLQEFQLTDDEINTLLDKLISHPAAKQVTIPNEDFGIGPGPHLYYQELRIRKDGKEWVLQHQSKPDKPELHPQRGMSLKQWNELSIWLGDFIQRVQKEHKQAEVPDDRTDIDAATDSR